ncbi:fungal-specific transcription factor domain-containing protein [Dactylonectria estremocensis]|uniref:Fungal-specific transcription factor domain-containing protein n=1 Tax=Dactylonectria estremocensis TaxID=1079267 RepID=A0A9P9EUR0_9HYPO|nr:fungal-specific transcription factor domain-containing protein [Dactylonectria estremocensis]
MGSTGSQTDAIPAQLPPLHSLDPPRRLPVKTRKRARKACLSCRARKVRCDVSQRGRPCANCYLDSEPCVVTGRASKYRRAQYDVQDGIQASLPPYAPLSQPSNSPKVAETATDLEATDLNNESPRGRPACLPDQQGAGEPLDFHHRDSHQADTQFEFPECPENPAGASSEQPSYLQGTSNNTFTPEDLPTFTLKPNNYSSTSFQSQWPMNGNAPGSSELSFFCYPFLRVTNIHQLRQQDVGFLECQGCLKVPMRPFLDEIVRHYFLHIHPFLPLIHEGDFWELYYRDPHYPLEETMPLLLLQAMLFAACTFISDSTVQALGYRDIRSMRATFLRRAKLLYDLECESSPLVIAQACVLLSFTSLSSSRKPNTIWLGLGIDNAKLAEAHLYATMSSSSRSKERNVLKRLWWCCIIRDRSIGLLMRLPIRITKDQFDFDADPLTYNDINDELHRSKVYNPATKQSLAEILAQSIKLYTALTDILSLILPPKGMHSPVQHEKDESHVKLQDCKAALERWHASAVSKLPNIRNCPDLTTSPARANSHESTILYKNLMYMYYHTARIVLCHYEVLQLDILRASTGSSYSLAEDLSTIFETRREVQDANLSITECHKELLRLGLVQWLPSSAIGFILLPLVLNILDTKLSPPPRLELDKSQASGITQQQLNILIQFMKVYWPRYDGVEWVSEIIRHITNLAQLDESKVRRKSSSINWADIFAFQPRSYLRLVLALDLSLSKGRLPQDWDFPIRLRGLFSFNANPLKELVEGNYTNLESLGVVNPPLQTESPTPPERAASNQVQHYVLGLDECLIATLENQFAFGGCIGLPEVAGSQSQGGLGTPSDHSEGLSSFEGSSPALNAENKENAESHACTASDCQGMCGREAADTTGEEMTDGFMEAILGEDFSETIL